MPDSYTVARLSPLRSIIAARTAEAKRTIPHFRLVADIEIDSLLALRAEMNDADPAAKVTVNDCIVKACASSLIEHPQVNIQLNADEIHQYRDADISVVVAVAGGLATPIVRAANHKSVREIAAEVRTLSTRAAAGQLKMSEISGGTFSISNLGAYELEQFDAIINPPQCAILAVARARPRVVASSRGDMRVATTLRATLSVDHRAIDGATGAAFLMTLREKLQRPREILQPSGSDLNPW